MGGAVTRLQCRREDIGGFGLIEIMIAMTILLVGLAAMLNLFTLAAGLNAKQGDVAKRVTEYAQDKMEQLLALDFSDGSTNTTVYPPATSGGTGLGGAMAVNTTAPAGGINPGAPAAGYVDYLGASGNLLGDSSGAFYVRLWSISTGATATLKTITVTVTAIRSVGPGNAASTTVVAYKSQTQ
jgi:hypothetical protein